MISTQDVVAAYSRWLDRAVDGGLLPPGGLTPREQGEHLVRSGAFPPRTVRRLVDLIERCVYAGVGDDRERSEAAALCEEFAAAPALRESVRRTVVRDRRFGALGVLGWLAPVGGLARRGAPLFAIAALAGGVFLLGRAGCSLPSLGGGSASGGGGGAAPSRYGGEVSAVRSEQGSWSTPATRRTVRRARVPPVLDMRQALAWRRPSLDRTTGVDIDFERLHDPFRPPLGQTHRLNVFSRVDEAFQHWAVGEPLRDAEGDGEDGRYVYKARLRVELPRNIPMPVPSPTADAEVIAYSSQPAGSLRFVKDVEDTLYAISERAGTVDLSYTLVARDDYAFARLPEVPFVPVPDQLPDEVRRQALLVAEAIGSLPGATYAETVRRLHAYFSGFAVSPIDARDERESEFLTLALARKGVCRHRARTFVVVANAVGVPARLVENRVHSFAEVQLPDGGWRRLEFRLGEGEQAPHRRDAAARAAGAWTPPQPGPFPGVELTVLVLVGVIVGLVARQYRRSLAAHLLRGDRELARGPRRAERDASGGWLSASLGVLVGAVRRRLARWIGASGDDTEALRQGLDGRDLPRPLRPRLAALLAIDSDDVAAGRWTTSDVQYAYWNCYHIVQWMEQRERATGPTPPEARTPSSGTPSS